MCVCVCVCVYLREREAEIERERSMYRYKTVWINQSEVWYIFRSWIWKRKCPRYHYRIDSQHQIKCTDKANLKKEKNYILLKQLLYELHAPKHKLTQTYTLIDEISITYEIFA